MANITIIKISFDEISNTLFRNGVAFLAITKNRSIYPTAINTDVRAPTNDVAPPSTNPETTDKYTAKKYHQT